MSLNSDRSLPVELLDTIIVEVLHNSLHAVCTSSDDVEWELNVLGTLSRVSKGFMAIAVGVACDAFELRDPPEKRSTSSALLEVQKIMVYMRKIGKRLRHPSDWDLVNMQSFECHLSTLVLGYALYLSSISLRLKCARTSMDMFRSTYSVAHSALSQSLLLCDRVSPRDISRKLLEGINDELSLFESCHDIVQSAEDLSDLLAIIKSEPISILPDDYAKAGQEILDKICNAEKRYRKLTENRPLDPKPYELLHVLPTLRRFQNSLLEKEGSVLHDRFTALIHEWSIYYCPFFSCQKNCEDNSS